MSNFTSMLEQAPETRSVNGVVERWLASIDADDRKDFINAVNDPAIPTVTIAHVMRLLGYTGGSSTFSHWRNAKCRK